MCIRDSNIASYRSFTVFGPKCFSFTNTLAAYCCWFLCISISQSSVATQLRCGGMFDMHFIANCLQNVPVKELWKSVNINLGKIWTIKSGTFLGTQCIAEQTVTSRHQVMYYKRIKPKFHYADFATQITSPTFMICVRDKSATLSATCRGLYRGLCRRLPPCIVTD